LSIYLYLWDRLVYRVKDSMVRVTVWIAQEEGGGKVSWLAQVV
jgi:hypothetical protein